MITNLHSYSHDFEINYHFIKKKVLVHGFKEFDVVFIQLIIELPVRFLVQLPAHHLCQLRFS
jgi:hypothetical protein